MRRAALLLVALMAGCALTRKSSPMEVRYFTPARPGASSAASPPLAGPAPAVPARLQLRLGRVDGASYLTQKMAYRDSANEVGYYETLRWTESPEAFVRRALERALFEQHGVQEVVSGVAPALEIEVTAFEEVRAPRHVVRVELTWKLRDHRTVLVQRTVVVERPVADAADGELGNVVANATGEALAEAVEAVVAGVVTELNRVTPAAGQE